MSAPRRISYNKERRQLTGKEPRKGHCGAQALDGRIHIACIPQILQAHRTDLHIRPVRHRVF